MVAGYILDTSILSAYLDHTHRKHSQIFSQINLLAKNETLYLSVIALGLVAK